MFGALAGFGLLGALLPIAAGIAVLALLLMVAFRMVPGCMPSYLRAAAVVMVATLASALMLGLVHAFGGAAVC